MINREQCGQFIDANTDNMVKDWKRLVEIETGSFDKEGLEEAAGTLKAMFEGIGFRCDLIDTGAAGKTLTGILGRRGKESRFYFPDIMIRFFQREHWQTIHSVSKTEGHMDRASWI